MVSESASVEERIAALLERMTLEEKIGQLCQVQGAGGHVSHDLHWAVREGRLGSVLNEVDVWTVNELQRIAVEESRLGIPLLVGRDVIHGFKTVFPIPLGQAASWNPELVRQCAHVAANEAAAHGINWTFAPMIDVSRDPRWGRVAESFGEDPFLTGELGAAMIRGFQGDDLTAPGSIAACAKHFAGYGAVESGRDYNTTNIPENELRNVHLPPFHAAVKAGVASLMTSFSDVNGVPASANVLLLRQILRDEWGFDGLVVSDWESIRQLTVHGFTEDDRESAFAAADAGVDMEMASRTYADHLPSLIAEGRISVAQIDAMVTNILRVKTRLGLFESSSTDRTAFPDAANAEHLAAAKQAALESVVLLKNDNALLPLSADRRPHIAIIGPLADDEHEQLGTWIFDGDPQHSRTALEAIRAAAGETAVVTHVRALQTTRSREQDSFPDAVAAVRDADVAILFLGEEAILSGEAHCRAHIGLPGAQEALINALSATGTPLVLVVMAGRPLALESVIDGVQAVLYAWHPGTMGGPAIADLLFGIVSPSGKLPITLPRVTGQIPIYYAHKRTGKPPTAETVVHMDDIAARAPQLSVGNTSFHLDVDHTPLFPFGYGLSYAQFVYTGIRLSESVLHADRALVVCADVTNTGHCDADEVVQLYVRDRVGNVTRPVRELKGFTRAHLRAGESRAIEFTITPDDLAFFGRANTRMIEPGRFDVWIGGSSLADLHAEFVLTDIRSQ